MVAPATTFLPKRTISQLSRTIFVNLRMRIFQKYLWAACNMRYILGQKWKAELIFVRKEKCSMKTRHYWKVIMLFVAHWLGNYNGQVNGMSISFFLIFFFNTQLFWFSFLWVPQKRIIIYQARWHKGESTRFESGRPVIQFWSLSSHTKGFKYWASR